MIRILPLLLVLPLSAATVKVGTFPVEIKHGFTTTEGLADNRVNCLATAGKAVYAGTAKGLAVFEGGTAWHPVPAFTAQPVDVCTSSGNTLYLTHNGGLHRVTEGRPSRLAALPAGSARALAVRGAAVFLALDRGLYELKAGQLVKVPAAAMDVRQMAAGPEGQHGQLAVAAAEGVFLRGAGGKWAPVYPRAGNRSWAPVDARGAAYDAQGLLWIATPQGAGCFDGKIWRLLTGEEGLPYDDFTTLAIGEPGVIWFGTTRGAIRYDGKTWEYRQGLRWLPDDNVRSIAVSANGDAWFGTAQGAGLIERKPMTLAEKARYFEDEIDKRHRRTPYGYVMAVRLPKAGDKTEWTQHDSDNDGLWTSMYGAGECFAYAATRDPLAKQRARKAFEALRFLSEVTQGGEHPAPPGFPARAILPTSGPDPNPAPTATICGRCSHRAGPGAPMANGIGRPTPVRMSSTATTSSMRCITTWWRRRPRSRKKSASWCEPSRTTSWITTTRWWIGTALPPAGPFSTR
ncbi:MAG: hypothetical protein NTY38_04335 [Acidobacteria bacterium]|nr:hypothetical protein [Acidobacteriota bacterium]